MRDGGKPAGSCLPSVQPTRLAARSGRPVPSRLSVRGISGDSSPPSPRRVSRTPSSPPFFPLFFCRTASPHRHYLVAAAAAATATASTERAAHRRIASGISLSIPLLSPSLSFRGCLLRTSSFLASSKYTDTCACWYLSRAVLLPARRRTPFLLFRLLALAPSFAPTRLPFLSWLLAASMSRIHPSRCNVR